MRDFSLEKDFDKDAGIGYGKARMLNETTRMQVANDARITSSAK